MTELQDCFAITDWTIFARLNIEQYAATVLDYINFSIGNVTKEDNMHLSKWKTMYEWEVCHLLCQRGSTFKAGNTAAYGIARSNLKRGIKAARNDDSKWLEEHFNNTSDPRRLWQALRQWCCVHVLSEDPSFRVVLTLLCSHALEVIMWEKHGCFEDHVLDYYAQSF